jgi:hypothetical protein
VKDQIYEQTLTNIDNELYCYIVILMNFQTIYSINYVKTYLSLPWKKIVLINDLI